MLPKAFNKAHVLRPAVGFRLAPITTIQDALKKSKQLLNNVVMVEIRLFIF